MSYLKIFEVKTKNLIKYFVNKIYIELIYKF